MGGYKIPGTLRCTVRMQQTRRNALSDWPALQGLPSCVLSQLWLVLDAQIRVQSKVYAFPGLDIAVAGACPGNPSQARTSAGHFTHFSLQPCYSSQFSNKAKHTWSPSHSGHTKPSIQPSNYGVPGGGHCSGAKDTLRGLCTWLCSAFPLGS